MAASKTRDRLKHNLGDGAPNLALRDRFAVDSQMNPPGRSVGLRRQGFCGITVFRDDPASAPPEHFRRLGPSTPARGIEKANPAAKKNSGMIVSA